MIDSTPAPGRGYGARYAVPTINLAPYDKAPMGSCIGALKASLTEIKEALANEDWSLLGDIVGYNLEALGKDWKVVLTALADHVQRSSQAEGKNRT